MSGLVGRSAIVEEIDARLGAGRAVVLHGPTGIGKSALLDGFEARAGAAGTRVLRARGAATETGLRYAALQDLIDQLPEPLPDDLPPALQAVQAGLVGAAPDGAADPAAAHRVHRAWRDVLRRLADDHGVLVLLDDAQWIDPDSLAALVFAGRRLVGEVSFVATWGADVDWPAGGGLLPRLDHVEVPPLAVREVVQLLGPHGIAPAAAERIGVQSGGLPALALALAGAAGERPSVLGRPSPTPPSITRMLHDRVAAQPEPVRETLVLAALLHRPTVRQLVRAGRPDADAHLRQAARAGLVGVEDEVVRFTPPALPGVLTGTVDAAGRAARHRALAEAATCAGARLRHQALADPAPHAVLARGLGDEAHRALTRGERGLASELFWLAAEHCPVELAPARVEWLAACVEAGAPGNHADLVYRALDEFLAGEATPAQRVRVRLALVELAGTGLAAVDEVLTAALAEAGDDRALLADVLMQRARVHLRESRPLDAERRASEAVRLLREAGDERGEALALPVLAVTRRWTGAGDHDELLQRALALPEPSTPGMVHTTPRYMAARFAFYDDRLGEAWETCLALLAGVERGAGQDTVHLLRCLVETGARLGRCREALTYAARAQRVAADFDLEPHTSWFITATAELVAGDLDRARQLAEQGVAACEEAGDRRYLQRHLLVLGQALLRQGDARGAVTALARLREIERGNGVGDPTVHRWHAELASALVVTGDLVSATTVLDEARALLAGRSGAEGTLAQLDRAEAELCLARNQVDRAADLLDAAERTCGRLSLRIDLGRVLMTRAQLERRRRRVAASRAALEQAHAVFHELHAIPWAAQARAATRLPTPRATTGADSGPWPSGADDGAPLEHLTTTEARIARQVAEGASNREIAERLFLSVKTVEATLTRIYRKLGIRSRTQLAALVLPGDVHV